MKGVIFDIQRFALHDGPGIRTVVFLKGCPFRCVWCCNPESFTSEPQIGYNQEKCKGCGECIKICPKKIISKKGTKVSVNHLECNTCGLCIESCITGALKIYGKLMNSESLINIILKDAAYYKNSGGGLTLSGGDPVFQFDFTIDLLKKTKQKSINTCLETEGFGYEEQFRKLLPIVDYFYFDYKISHSYQHKIYTGHYNDVILKNLEYLCQNNAHVTLRCPIIPNINDNQEHFRSIAILSRKYDAIRSVELMPYHNYGISKFVEIGKKPPELICGSVKPEQTKNWIKAIQQSGCNKIKI